MRTLDTLLIHAGEPEPRIEGAVAMPIFCSANYEYGGEANYHDLKYIRLNNTPNHRALHAKLSVIEGGEAAVVTASGMAAISTSLLSVLRAGDHVLVQDCLYGGTHSLVTEDLPSFGIEFDFVDARRPDTWSEKLKKTTRAFYVETITNPLLGVADLPAVVDFCREHGLVSLIDNTFASPVNYRPPEQGFDLSLHSATKYLNGHSDIVAGAVIGRAELVEKVTHRLNHLGGSLDPHACFLFHRGLKTLALRMARQNSNALALARFLADRSEVAQVNYPGLETHPDHARASQLFAGFGGVVSFEPRGGTEAAERLISRLSLPIVAPSLGGVETLVTRPATTSHSGVPRADRLAVGVTDSLVRVAVGIEDPADLVEDFRQALA